MDTSIGADASKKTAMAAIAFVDLAGFSAITEVFGDEAAVAVLDLFEGLVSESLVEGGRQVKWIGDEVMRFRRSRYRPSGACSSPASL
jgi:class 3 adenylate cyclase